MCERCTAQPMRLRGVEARHERVAGEYAGDGVKRAHGILSGRGEVTADAAEGFGLRFAAEQTGDLLLHLHHPDVPFGQVVQVGRFLLEYDDQRSGTFELLRFVPKGKTVVLGLISTKRPQLESRSDLIRRIEEASRFVPIENLALSPQCGFASTMEGNLLTEAEQ